MFERIVAFWKGYDIVHLFGGFLRFGAQDKGPDQQHCQQPRGEPGEIQPHVLELGAPARKDLDGFIDGSHKEASRPHVEKGVLFPRVGGKMCIRDRGKSQGSVKAAKEAA